MKNKWEAVFFDFDGVILDSVDVKTQAFATMFRQYGPEVEKAVVDYHLANGGVSRYRKFEHYYSNLLKNPINDKRLEELGNEFNRLVLERVLLAPFIDGAIDALEQLRKMSIPAFVVSATPHEEIQYIVKKRDLGIYFVEVHGSPRGKTEITNNILSRKELNPQNCLFIGDALTDFEAASACGTEFRGIVKKNAFSPFPQNVFCSEKVIL